MAQQATIMAVDSFTGKLAVVTGGGSGMGRELVRQLAAQGCSVAACDLNPGAVAETAAMARAAALPGVRVTSHACDVSDEAQVLRFRDELLERHASDHVDLVFSNAGIGGGESFISGPREVWERVFAVDWWGVYYCARAFLPLLIASSEAVLVNTSSVNGFWASLGPGMPSTAYSAAKFAVKGFTEALIEDLRAHAPHVRVAVVMPGHVGTDIVANSLRARGLPELEQMSDAQLEELIPRYVRAALTRAGGAGRRRVSRAAAPVPGAHQCRFPGQGTGQRGAGGDRHPRRGASRGLADPGRRGRQDDRRRGAREARGRLRLRRVVQRAGARAAGRNT
jgi:NAD(P)-dependent dehydrogenase (short-subunit alcohol dehydrogenase family)